MSCDEIGGPVDYLWVLEVERSTAGLGPGVARHGADKSDERAEPMGKQTPNDQNKETETI